MRRGKQSGLSNGMAGIRFVLAGAVAVVLAATTIAPLGAQTGAAAFPASLVAPMLSPDEPAALAVRAVWLEGGPEGGDPTIVVQFAAPYTLPPDGYRLSVLFGEPGGQAVRASLRTVEGRPVGSLDKSQGDTFSEVGPLAATTTPEATARLTVPLESLPEEGVVWVVAETADPAASFTSPLYPIDQFLGRALPGSLSAARSAWMTSAVSPDPSVVDLPEPPTLTVEGTTARLTYAEPVPTEVDRIPLSSMVDVVRIAPDFDETGQAPYLVAVDHIAGRVNLLDGTQVIPATLETANDDWLLTELPAQVTKGTVVEFDLDAVAREFGITTSVDTTALGVARSMTLIDSRVVRADGVQGTLAWFESAAASAAAGAPASGAAEGAAAPSPAGGDADTFPWVIVIAVAAAIVALSMVGLLWRRRARRHTSDAEPRPNEYLLDSDGPLTLGRRMPAKSPDPGGPSADLDLRQPPSRAVAPKPNGLNPLFGSESLEVAPDQGIEVPDLALFDESAVSPAERPAAPRVRKPKRDDDLTKALFDADS